MRGYAQNGQDFLDHGILKSGVSQKRFDELSRLIAWFLHPESDWIVFGLTNNLLCIFEISWESIAVVFVKNVLLQWCPQGKFVGNKAEGRISQRVFHENKARQIFWKKKTFLTPFPFSENLACFVFLKHPFWDSPFCLITDKSQNLVFPNAHKDKYGKIACLMHTSRKYGKWPEI